MNLSKKHWHYRLLCMLLATVMLFSGCFDDDDSSTTTPNVPQAKPAEYKQLTCSATNSENYNDYVSFKDDTYYYYVFRIGRMYNVALEAGARDYYHGFETKEMQYKVSTIESSTVENTVNTIATHSNHQDFSFSESFEYEKTNERLSTLKRGERLKSSSFKFGITATQAWGFSETNTISKTYTTCAEKANSEEKTVTYTFDSTYPSGYYNYILMGDIDVYMLLLLNPNTMEYEKHDFSTVVSSNRQLIYTGENPEYSNTPVTPLQVDWPAIEERMKTPPTVDISDSMTDGAITFNFEPKNCNDGNKYDPSVQEHDANWKKVHDHFELGEIYLYGCSKHDEVYSIKVNEGLAIQIKLKEDPLNLPKTSEGKEIDVAYDRCTEVMGTSLGKEIGRGAYLLRITYNDGSDQYLDKTCNIFEGKHKGDVITVLTKDKIDSTKASAIAKIELTIIYELVEYRGAFLNLDPDRYTNWRCDYELNFVTGN